MRKAMDIAADICVYTNRNVTVETLDAECDCGRSTSFRRAADDHCPLLATLAQRGRTCGEWWGDPQSRSSADIREA